MDNVLKRHIFRQRDTLQVRVDAISAEQVTGRTRSNAILAEVEINRTRVDALLSLLLNRSFGEAGLAIHGINKDNLLTAAAFSFIVAGVPKNLAAQTEIVTPAATAQTVDEKCWYLLHVNASGTISFTKGVDHATTAVIPAPPADEAVFGAVHVSLASGAGFTLGTTVFDALNVTSTYFDSSYLTALAALAATGVSALSATGIAALGAFVDI